MKKFLNMNSFFTRIILAVFSFAVIISVFIPYMKIPAVASIKDVDVEKKLLTRKIGKDQPSFSITEFTHSTSPAYELYENEEFDKIAHKDGVVTLNEDVNTYYFVAYAYGYDAKNKAEGLKSNVLGKYKMLFIKGASSSAPVEIKINREKVDDFDGTIEVTVPKKSEFDLKTIITTKNAWYKLPSNTTNTFTDESTKIEEPKNIPLDEKTPYASIYASICFKSILDNDPSKTDDNVTVYHPLDAYEIYVEKDLQRNTLPIVGEVGGGIMSGYEFGVMKFYEKDMFVFIFMIGAAIATIFAVTIPNKLRFIELIIAGLLGIGLIIVPIIDILFYVKWGFKFEIGCFLLIGLGVIILLWSIFDYNRCTSDYRKEQIHIYGEDFFSKERKIRMAEEKKIKDAEYNALKKAEKEAAKLAKAEEKAALAAHKAEQKAKKK